MAVQHIDIERMIMQARYKMQLEAEASSVRGGQLSDMEREQYQNQIKDLLQAVETLLKSNKAMGERVTQLEKVAEAYDDLKAENEMLQTAARTKTRINTSRTGAITMCLQLTMARKGMKRMLPRWGLRKTSLAI